jgi:hypothetical protein
MVARPNPHTPAAADAGDPHEPTAFVELLAPIGTVPRQCLIEFETGQGTRLRVQLSGSPLADVIAIGRRLRRAASGGWLPTCGRRRILVKKLVEHGTVNELAG